MTRPISVRSAVAVASGMAIAFALSGPGLAQRPPSTTDTSRGLSVQYVDGRSVTRPLRPTGRMWTQRFPRIKGANTSRNGLVLSTLDVRHVVDGSDVIVTVALSYGAPMKNLVEVASVRVTPAGAVAIDGLRAYGVEPITLSLVAIPSAVVYVPDVFSVSAQVEMGAEVVGPNASAYRVLLTNRSTVPLMWVQFKGYRGDREIMSARPRGKRSQPLITPNAEYIFDLATTSTGDAAGDLPEAWRPLDRIEITSLMWQDGVVEGDTVAAVQQSKVDARRAEQINALLGFLRGAADGSTASIRSQFERAMMLDFEIKEAGGSVLADLDALDRTQRSRAGQDFATWLRQTILEYQQWLARIVLPKL